MRAPELRIELRAQDTEKFHSTGISIRQTSWRSSCHPRGITSGAQSRGSSHRLGASWRRGCGLNLGGPAGPGLQGAGPSWPDAAVCASSQWCPSRKCGAVATAGPWRGWWTSCRNTPARLSTCSARPASPCCAAQAAVVMRTCTVFQWRRSMSPCR